MRLALIAALALAACASTPESAIPLDAETHPSFYDFGRLRFEEPARFEAMQREIEADFARAEAADARLRAIPAAERPPQCEPDLAERISLRAWVNLAASAPDRAAWDRDAAILRERVRDIAAASVAWRHGAESVDERARSAHLDEFVRGLESAQDSRTRELFLRVLRDQTLRYGFGFDPTTARWIDGLSPEANEAWRKLLGGLIVNTDCFNASWLRGQLTEIEWFDSRTFGASADRASWLLAQHADLNTALQVDVLRRLERLARDGGTNASNFAYLWDRVAVAEGRPQRFGTQMECVGDANQPTGGLEDADRVEERRAELRMQTYASYLEVMARLNPCSPP